jgi:hypothetical protein
MAISLYRFASGNELMHPFWQHMFLAYDVYTFLQDDVISPKSHSSWRELLYDDSAVLRDICWFFVIRLHCCSK